MANISKNTNIPLKDKKLSIWYKVYDEDDLGQTTVKGYEKIHTGKLWTHYRQTSANEFFRAVAYDYEENTIFTINYRNDIDNSMLILYNHKVYNINHIDDYEGYKRELRISAKTSNYDSPDHYKGMTDN